MREMTQDRSEPDAEFIKKQMEFVLGMTKTGLDIIDADFNLVYVDPAWQKVYGDFRGRKCFEYFAGRGSMCETCAIPEALAKKKPVVSEEVLPKEGNRPIQVTTIPFRDDNGNWMVAEINIDITELKRTEDDLKKRLNQIERLYKVTLGREKMILKLKAEVKALKADAGGESRA
ncbi:MAG: PAS domain-containing protein [Candidatus Omnitrophota bacterium]